MNWKIPLVMLIGASTVLTIAGVASGVPLENMLLIVGITAAAIGIPPLSIVLVYRKTMQGDKPDNQEHEQ